ncbi:hypothetical protein FQA39_LY16134 [Lamprigera yunnana]|nr:hypothetical protein FQA39_LY16134 [Lamprigera yunnana]
MVMADVEASDNENYDDTLKIILQQITAEKRVLQNNPSHEQFSEAEGNENIKTPIEPNVQDMYFNPHSNVASTSTSSVIVTPKRSFAIVFNDVIPWPHHTPTVGKRKKEALLHLNDGDSLDDIVINEVTDQETDDIILQVEDLKVGDYILALFVSTGKRTVVHYKYVAKILQVMESDDFKVLCLKSLDETKTTFKIHRK